MRPTEDLEQHRSPPVFEALTGLNAQSSTGDEEQHSQSCLGPCGKTLFRTFVPSVDFPREQINLASEDDQIKIVQNWVKGKTSELNLVSVTVCKYTLRESSTYNVCWFS